MVLIYHLKLLVMSIFSQAYQLTFTVSIIAANNNASASSTPYDSGHDHGCDDANISDP